MNYVVADIHGCYEEYIELMQKINLSEKDHLYILGDTLDRGPNPMKVLLDIMKRKNVIYILGNHDYLFLYFVQKKGLGISGKQEMSVDDILEYHRYLEDGGFPSVKEYMQLSKEEKEEVCDFLENAKAYDEVRVDNKRYVLVHAGIADFLEEKSLGEYDLLDFICERTDYRKRYYQDKNTYVITGHTPVMRIHEDSFSKVYTGNGHIAIDCGCVYGAKLAAYCIDSGETIYVKAKKCYL